MNRVAVVCGLVLLAVAGCGVDQNNGPLGRWNVTVTKLPPEEQQATGSNFLGDSLALAVRIIAQGKQQDAHFLKAAAIEAEFRGDGSCSLIVEGDETKGTWTLTGEGLIQNYQGQPGTPGTVAWDGANAFNLAQPGGAAFRFERGR
jgi:hypothetical protein